MFKDYSCIKIEIGNENNQKEIECHNINNNVSFEFIIDSITIKFYLDQFFDKNNVSKFRTNSFNKDKVHNFSGVIFGPLFS